MDSGCVNCNGIIYNIDMGGGAATKCAEANWRCHSLALWVQWQDYTSTTSHIYKCTRLRFEDIDRGITE